MGRVNERKGEDGESWQYRGLLGEFWPTCFQQRFSDRACVCVCVCVCVRERERAGEVRTDMERTGEKQRVGAFELLYCICVKKG